MSGVARENDTESGVCMEYVEGTGYVPMSRSGILDQEYSPDVNTNDRSTVRKGDKGTITSGPHAGELFEVIEGSGSVNVNGQPIAREGDSTKCSVCGDIEGEEGSIDSGSSNVNAGG